jgi:hypothetical protein
VNAFLKLCAAGLACTLINTATIVATSQPAPVDANASTINKSSVAMVVALNPQPLPPYVGGDDDYDFLRG